jgi:tRNA 5-methylaminomethyl-2-thiouridine biosynthesis bifunctional protein
MPDRPDHAVWRVLDADFSDGQRFFACWSDWEQDPQRPALLHYVAIARESPDVEALAATLQGHTLLSAQGTALRRQWPGPASAGFHRITLSFDRVHLTLCIGPLQAMLREQEFVADAAILPADRDRTGGALWDRWALKSLTRLCRRGTTLDIFDAAPRTLYLVAEAGFVLDDNVGHRVRNGRFDPRWEPGQSRHRWRRPPAAPSECIVVGAGLAGAAVAAALARRGWHVTVLDAASAPATGASGLPVGLLVPQVTRDDAARSRLSRAGVRMTLQWCHALLRRGEDWAPSGGRQLFPHDPSRAPIWHADAAWIKPERLVQACLAQTGVRFVGDAAVDRVVRQHETWRLLDAAGGTLGRASQLVLAAADRCVPLLARVHGADGLPLAGLIAFKTMPSVGGRVSWGLHDDEESRQFPGVPVNGRGHFVSGVPMQGARAWFVGATYENPADPQRDEASGHAENRLRLRQLCPSAEQLLAPRFETSQVRSWHGIRCTTTDRLPAVGPLQHGASPSLWMSAAMGSRGLTYAMLCAELLAGSLAGEPLAVEGSLVRLLATTRTALSDHL